MTAELMLKVLLLSVLPVGLTCWSQRGGPSSLTSQTKREDTTSPWTSEGRPSDLRGSDPPVERRAMTSPHQNMWNERRRPTCR